MKKDALNLPLEGFLRSNRKLRKMKKKKEPQPIFDSIRKPTAPPSRKIGDNKPDEKAHPARRKAKHKKKDADNDD